MKAEIEVGRNVRAFWLAAAAMVSEHTSYYARENGFRANARMFRGMVDAINAGSGTLAPRLIMAGCSPEVQQAIADEERFAPLSMATYGVVSRPVTGGESGADWALDGKAVEVTWTTSGGNSLTIRLDGEWFTCIVEGRRHGIPWRFLEMAGLRVSDLLVVAMASESTAKPWCDGTGNTLAFNGNTPVDNLADVTVHPKPGEWPSWGDTHQQAGWVADKVCDADSFAQFCRTCAKFEVPSTAVRFTPLRSFGVFRLSPPGWSVNWSSSAKLMAHWINHHRDCSHPVVRHDTAKNWFWFVWPENCELAFEVSRHESDLPPKGDMEAVRWFRYTIEELEWHQRGYMWRDRTGKECWGRPYWNDGVLPVGEI